MKRSLMIATFVCICFGFGCANREHIRDSYGTEVRTFFAKQHVYAQAVPDAPRGLDSEEAAMIHDGYRKSLGAPAVTSDDESSQALMLREPKAEASK